MTKGRLLFVGDLAPHCRTYQRYRAFGELGYEVEGVTSSPVDYQPGITPLSFRSRLLFKLRRPLDETGANSKLVEAAKRFRPDVIWVERALMIRRAAIEQAIAACDGAVKVFSYSEDDMFAPHNQSRYYLDCLPQYDVVFTTKSYNCRPEELPALGARRVVFVDKAYDRHAHRPIELTAREKAELGADVGFIGTFEADRARQCLLLARHGFPVRIWGNGWGGLVGTNPNLRIENRPMYGDDYVKALRATRINLCFLRKMNRDLQTDRTMELPACGAFMLAERSEEHLRLFEEGKEAAYFDVDRDDELIAKVSYYLEHESERLAVAAAGRKRAVNSGYSHHERLEWMMTQGNAACAGAAYASR